MSLDEISLDLEWVLILMTSVLIREGRGELETHGGRPKAGTGVMRLQAEDAEGWRQHQKLQEAGSVLPEPPEGPSPADILVTDFQPPDCERTNFSCLSCPRTFIHPQGSEADTVTFHWTPAGTPPIPSALCPMSLPLHLHKRPPQFQKSLLGVNSESTRHTQDLWADTDLSPLRNHTINLEQHGGGHAFQPWGDSAADRVPGKPSGTISHGD